MQRRFFQCSSSALTRCATLLLLLCATPTSYAQRLEDPVYKNPLSLQSVNHLSAEHCAEPSVTRGQTAGDNRWYLFCSSGPFGDSERDSNGKLIVHTLPMFSSLDLVNWTFVGDAIGARPAWAHTNATLSAPDVQFFNGAYYLYYTVATTDTISGSTIGVATSSAPTGPWVASGAPVIETYAAQQLAESSRSFSDATILVDDTGQKYLYYHTSLGGIAARALSADGLRSDPATEVQLTTGTRYESASVLKRNGFYYMLASTLGCCGPLTGANMFAARAARPLGPFVDQAGRALTSARAGGTPVISANGNRWVGASHGKVISDLQGQNWLIYHAVDRLDPYFAREPGVTKSPTLMDQLDWIDDWPTVRGGRWASDSPTPAPATQPGDVRNEPLSPPRPERLEAPLPLLSDEFNGPAFSQQWAWVRPPALSSYGFISGTLQLNTQLGNLIQDSNTAAVLTEPAPSDSYVVETRIRLNIPLEGCCYNAVQAGLVIYGDDDNYIKLTHTLMLANRQVEFAKELAPVLPGYPRYGSMTVGTPSEWTYLRILRRTVGSEDNYTAYTSSDGANWVRGGTWTHNLGFNARIGLVAMGGAGYVANFDYVHVYPFKSNVTSPTSLQEPQPLFATDSTSVVSR